MSVVFTNRGLLAKNSRRAAARPTNACRPKPRHHEVIPNIVLTTAENLTITNLSVAGPLEDSDIESLPSSRRGSSVYVNDDHQLPSQATSSRPTLARPSILRKISQTSQSNLSHMAMAGPNVPSGFRPCATIGLKLFIVGVLMIDVFLFYLALIQASLVEEVIYLLDRNRSISPSTRTPLDIKTFNTTIARYRQLSGLARPVFNGFPLEHENIPSNMDSVALEHVFKELKDRKSHLTTQTIFTFVSLPMHLFGLLSVSLSSISLTFTHLTLTSLLLILEYLQVSPTTLIEQVILLVHLVYRVLCALFCYSLYRWKLAQ